MQTSHFKMTHLGLFLAVFCTCYAHATMVNVDNVEIERFTLADSKPARMATVFKPKDNIAAASRPPSNIVYGKAKGPRINAYVAPGIKPKSPKFKPSQEYTSEDIDSYTQYAQGYKPTPQETAALQKYMQKYASQVYAAQKHAAQFSEPQKGLGSSEAYKYVAPSQKYKFVPVVSQESKINEKVKEHEAVDIANDQYKSVQVHQHVVVQPSKPMKSSPPKKAYSFDSSQQPSDFKYSTHEGLSSTSEKESWSSYEPYQSYGHYGVLSSEKSADFSKITGYKIPSSSSLNLGGHVVDTKVEEEKTHHEEEHYPHHEPKYEYMYQVHDPEKHNNFGHSEARKGKNTWGRYYVQLPDGRLETVKYWVDKHGYHAEVDFKGQAQHPSHKEYAHHEEKPKYTKGEEISLHGHSETSYSIGEPGEEF